MSDERPPAFERVCPARDLKAGQGKSVVLAGRSVACFRIGAACHAVSGRCPHNGHSLHDGSVEGGVVTCRWHGWRFDLATGRSPGAVEGDGGPRIRVYPVRVLEDWIEVSPEPGAPDPLEAAPPDDQPG